MFFKKKVNKPVFVAYIFASSKRGGRKSECPFSFARWIENIKRDSERVPTCKFNSSPLKITGKSSSKHHFSGVS